jgi:hypothetical protein
LEVKTNDGSLRDKDWGYMNNTAIYTPTNWDPTIDGGFDLVSCSWNAGNVTATTCGTNQYIEKVNETTLCGFDD